MNQVSAVGFDTDATTFSAFAQAASDRLGNFDLIVENTGDYTLWMQVRQWDGTSSPSGYANVGAGFLVVPRGVITKSYNLLSKRVAFFGSGNTGVTNAGTATSTKANITTVIRNKSDLRGAQIDVVAVGRANWKYDDGFKKPTLTKNWGTVNESTGAITAGEGV